jgi:hypothetical protein
MDNLLLSKLFFLEKSKKEQEVIITCIRWDALMFLFQAWGSIVSWARLCFKLPYSKPKAIALISLSAMSTPLSVL